MYPVEITASEFQIKYIKIEIQVFSSSVNKHESQTKSIHS